MVAHLVQHHHRTQLLALWRQGGELAFHLAQHDFVRQSPESQAGLFQVAGVGVGHTVALGPGNPTGCLSTPRPVRRVAARRAGFHGGPSCLQRLLSRCENMRGTDAWVLVPQERTSLK